MVYVTHVARREREQERILQPIVKPLLMNQLPAGGWAAGGLWTSTDNVCVCRCPPELGVPGAPRWEKRGSGYRRTDFQRPALGDGRQGGGENKLCMS